MVNVGESTTIGGHWVTRVPVKGNGAWEYECADCDKRGPAGVFTRGRGLYSACPERPESMTGLSVCAGGDRCEGHMRHDTPEFRQWKNSPSMSSDLVPRSVCTAEEMGLRAARQFLNHADSVGLRMRVWATEGLASKVGRAGGVCARFHHANGFGYAVKVNTLGRVTVEREEKR